MPRRCGLVMQRLGSLPKTIPLRHYQQCVRFAIWADIRTGWDQQPASLRHEFLHLILDRVLVNAQSDAVEATMVWRSGGEQHLWIERPLRQRGGRGRWTEAHHAWLREHYAASTVQDLGAQFPRRDYQAIRRQAETLGLTRPPRGRPKPKGRRWSNEENAVLQGYAAGEMSYAELCGRLPGRSWGAIASQGRLLGIRLRSQAVYYRLVNNTREIIDTEDLRGGGGDDCVGLDVGDVAGTADVGRSDESLSIAAVRLTLPA